MAIGDSGAVRRYSRASVQRSATSATKSTKVTQKLEQVTQTFASSAELRAVLHHPRITRTRRKSCCTSLSVERAPGRCRRF
jgi:F0F1-type ATP synthase delta subunit